MRERATTRNDQMREIERSENEINLSSALKQKRNKK
jgi:hypothetical protein